LNQTIHKATGIQLDITADLHKWRAFLAIAELGSLTRAALYLDVDQSVLSRRINALERECSARLFNRTGRGVELSEIGARIFPNVERLLADAEQLENKILSEARVPTGQVTVALLPSISNPLIRILFARMQAQYPGIHIKILEGSSGQVEEWLADARVDIAVFYRYGTSLPEGEQSLATVDTYLIGAKGDAVTAAKEVAFQSLDGLPFILPSAPNGLRNALDRVARDQKVTLEAKIEADSLPLMKLLVEQDGLYTVLPLHAVWTEVSEGKLQASKLVSPGMERTISMGTSKSKGPARAVAEVAAAFIAIVDEMGQSGMWGAHEGAAKGAA
jgi:DNA-binding transcriptional LysR family regulator